MRQKIEKEEISVRLVNSSQMGTGFLLVFNH